MPRKRIPVVLDESAYDHTAARERPGEVTDELWDLTPEELQEWTDTISRQTEAEQDAWIEAKLARQARAPVTGPAPGQ